MSLLETANKTLNLLFYLELRTVKCDFNNLVIYTDIKQPI